MLQDSPSTITPGDHGSVKFHYRRHGSDKFASTTTYHDDLVPLPSMKTCAPQASSSTTVDGEGFGVIRHLSKRTGMTIIAEIARTSTDDLGTCTTTVVEDSYLYRFPNMYHDFHDFREPLLPQRS